MMKEIKKFDFFSKKHFSDRKGNPGNTELPAGMQ